VADDPNALDDSYFVLTGAGNKEEDGIQFLDDDDEGGLEILDDDEDGLIFMDDDEQ
jgi:hypothetical protein